VPIADRRPPRPTRAAPDPARGVVARDVRLVRDGRAVLDGAALRVPPGDVTALIAPSGAGKSSLLRCLVRLLEPDGGSIALDGVPVAELDPRTLRRRVALVAQSPVMLPGSVRENLTYGLDAPLADPAAHDALIAAGLADAFLDRDADALSGGERARVAIARALVRRPEVLLLDEPTAALDHDVALVVVDALRALADRGLAVCLATHDLPLARRVADRCVTLDGGDAVVVGGPAAAGGGLAEADGSPATTGRSGTPGDVA
jgi:ABC-type multidrug transport system fused ATPase/permease subunit